MQPLVARIGDRRAVTGQTRLTKRLAQRNLANELLDGPIIPDKLRGQEIEQLRMGRSFAHSAEVIGGRDDTSTEQMMPNSIDHNARCQRIVEGLAMSSASWSRPLPDG